jgi:DNA-binding PadR family transcriptional regulator
MDETPIMFQPSLAKLVGLHEAIVLQTLRFWCSNKRSGKLIDGERWIYNSAAEWRELSFPFWSTKTIGDIFLTLERMGLVRSEQFDLKQGKARKYYTLTQSALTILTVEKANQLEESSDTMWKNVLGDAEDSSRSARARLIKQYTENLTENTKPPTPLQGGVESSAPLSHSTDSSSDLFPPDQITADAKASEASASRNDPPTTLKRIQGATRENPPPRKPRQPKLVDDAFIAQLASNNPRIDMDTELRKMDNWLLAHPNRQKTRPFVTNWINRCATPRSEKDETPRLPNGEIDWANVKPRD